jgi:uncharacterized protein
MNLILSQERLTVCKLPADASVPGWATAGNTFVSITRTDEELSIVCEESLVPSDVPQEAGWRRFKVEGPLDFSLVGILAAIAQPLATAAVSIFAISTHNTDYVLVKDAQIETALQALRNAGHAVRTD